AQMLAAQKDSAELSEQFAPVAAALADKEGSIVDELNAVQGEPLDIGGYYAPDQAKLTAAMRPSISFNAIIDSI
ncbi:MAG: NADP-dependent isocitrate dehydrogenase, partial [Akkermansiaceae bacterium]